MVERTLFEEWTVSIRPRLVEQYAKLSDNFFHLDEEVMKVIMNLDKMVDALSRLQVECKHGKHKHYAAEVKKFYDYLHEMEQLFLMRVLAR
jgi:hypothetical protein